MNIQYAVLEINEERHELVEKLYFARAKKGTIHAWSRAAPEVHAGGQLQGENAGGAACLILDQPAAGGQEPSLREELTEQVNRLELRWAYRCRDGMARSILSGPPAALGELPARLE